jgi:hypothetical protein
MGNNAIKKSTRVMKQLLLEFREFVKIGIPGAGQKISIGKSSSVTLVLTIPGINCLRIISSLNLHICVQ